MQKLITGLLSCVALLLATGTALAGKKDGGDTEENKIPYVSQVMVDESVDEETTLNIWGSNFHVIADGVVVEDVTVTLPMGAGTAASEVSCDDLTMAACRIVAVFPYDVLPGDYLLTIGHAKGTIGYELTVGAIGLQGPQGDIGPQGEQGIQGSQGDQGPQGIQGETGPQGLQGDTGPQGEQGSQGLTGDTGPQGQVGPPGADGMDGAPGADGMAGPQGPPGDDGAAGADGAVGETGLTGPQGPQGIPGTNGTNGTSCSLTACSVEGEATLTCGTTSVVVPCTFTPSNEPSNEAPVITNNGGAPTDGVGGPTATVNATENKTAVTTVTATDANPGDTLSFSITGGADQALFSIGALSGVLTFNSAPDFETPLDADGFNDYEVQVTVTDDGVGTLTDVQAITVTVVRGRRWNYSGVITDCNDAICSLVPLFIGDPVIGSIEIAVGINDTFTLATDPSGGGVLLDLIDFGFLIGGVTPIDPVACTDPFDPMTCSGVIILGGGTTDQFGGFASGTLNGDFMGGTFGGLGAIISIDLAAGNMDITVGFGSTFVASIEGVFMLEP